MQINLLKINLIKISRPHSENYLTFSWKRDRGIHFKKKRGGGRKKMILHKVEFI